ncbi:aminodeoxychorismate synthase component I [Peribacillus huizhouensis]|uniref:Para-aminobenzoate synthetase/4-amino-4-deoxychorismate lyase n=1 Tax=Peribacillus huizhouensis TaxID=1501239 RepID=A0ABR6CPV0_9BACI|nr:aminodeoxychorismate synthase component I [Peribacillus huizhouensis]MBA9027062.1 para-aminobenzoate synthetase/4-amino-4-deoxychorismate lyase [Peribacillus huizhouensis]
MNKRAENIHILLEFNKECRFFQNPLKIIEAHTIDEVLKALENIQKEVNAGYYAAGYLSYEAAPAFDPAYQVAEENKMPLLWFGIFEKFDNRQLTETPADFTLSDWQSKTTYETYKASIQKIKQQIEEGNTYQVNYTMRLNSSFIGDEFSFYRQLAKAQSSNYSAYLNTGRYKILSASPELFFDWRKDTLTTRPMKGTAKRGYSIEQDLNQQQWLQDSEKNRAENLMIVDLLRNDLGQIAEAGSVVVDRLFEIEQYPTVWQMTSTITAKTKPETTIIDLFKALFPCGSITGAPKISTMKIISELEQSPREVYCGAIGYITPNHEATFNVPIRTVVIDSHEGLAQYGVGGGITWDSNLTEEYDEAFLKAALLTAETPDFELLESLKLENGQYVLLENHLKRLSESARYFDFNLSIPTIKGALEELAVKHKTKDKKVRLLVSKTGKYAIEAEEIKLYPDVLHVTLAKKPISSNDVFLYHKTTNRTVYQLHKDQHPNYFDVLLMNEKGEITEFTNGNIVLKIDDELITPALHSGLLAGTFREELIRNGTVKERVVHLTDLESVNDIWFINSVRGWVKVNLL